ncbi:MAG: helix-turn-helix domain-containing protein [Chloroflexota bacterium]|nr:helix-turn-helix domain-containing protein [Chloroflexota bacterium]MDQ6905896.1 helix-turn-helix domain-containing protein [Chloroflexota bacterium]
MVIPERPFALSIRSARMERQLTQGELAARIGVTQSTVSFWESGVEAPTVEHLILLALELPEIIETFDGRERELLQRVLRLERELFAGRCACVGCSCQAEAAT